MPRDCIRYVYIFVTSRSLSKNSQEVTPDPSGRLPTPVPETDEKSDEVLQFTNVMQNLQYVYPKQAMNDISTSYCFICLLHLANEKGLVIEKQEGLAELMIRRDHTAEITVGGD